MKLIPRKLYRVTVNIYYNCEKRNIWKYRLYPDDILLYIKQVSTNNQYRKLHRFLDPRGNIIELSLSRSKDSKDQGPWDFWLKEIDL
jgi:hypothetical protein